MRPSCGLAARGQRLKFPSEVVRRSTAKDVAEKLVDGFSHPDALVLLAKPPATITLSPGPHRRTMWRCPGGPSQQPSPSRLAP